MESVEIASGTDFGFPWTLTTRWDADGALLVRLYLPTIERESTQHCDAPFDKVRTMIGSSAAGPVRMIVSAPLGTERVYVRTVAGRILDLPLHCHETGGGSVVLAAGLADRADPAVTVHVRAASGAEQVEEACLSPAEGPGRIWLPWRRNGVFRLRRSSL